jgi:ParB-like chromosome segregation protein Spo0J
MKIPIHCSHTRKAHPDDLEPHPRNPNRHSDQQIAVLAHIIENAGWRNPIVTSKRSGLVVKGHARLAAAIMLGLKEVPVDEQDYASEAEEVADLIADNRINELAELDYGIVHELLNDVEIFDTTFDLDLTGFDLFSRGDIKKKYAEPDQSENGEAEITDHAGAVPPNLTHPSETSDAASGTNNQPETATVNATAAGSTITKCPKCGWQLT